MDVVAFAHEPERLEPFLELAARVRADDPTWIPPLRQEVSRRIDPARPVVEGHLRRSFLALDGEVAVARCTATINPDLRADGGVVGQVGFFEAEDRYEAVAPLLEAACAWLREQGARQVWGPLDFSIWHDYRFMTRGFGCEPFLGEPRNPEYYPRLFTRFGFRPLARWYSWDLSENHLRGLHAATQVLKSDALEQGYRYQPFRTDEGGYAQDMGRAHAVVVDAFSENLGYTPIPEDEWRAVYGWARGILRGELSPLAIDPEGETIGIGYLYPDIGPAMRELGGDAGRLRELPGLLASHPPRRLVFHTMAVRKAARRKGLVEAYLDRVLEHVLAMGFWEAVGALAREGPSIFAKTGEPTREYTLYHRPLA